VSGRLAEVETRIGSVQQLSSVITAMRGIAAARSREARAHLDGVRAYARTVSLAIGDALGLLPEAERPALSAGPADGHAIIALCAEQGFAGTFSERVLDRVEHVAARLGGLGELLLVGDRGLMTARERGIAVAWSAPMVAHAGEVEALANRITEALYERLGDGRITRATIVHAVPGATAAVQVAERTLIPFDYGRFASVRRAVPPLVTLPPRVLVARLAAEYVFAELCEAVTLSFAAENDARMQAMIAARANVSKTLDELVALSRRLRQEEITDEIIELATGSY
jgi:F-type H+-transporting ATPase subunit gamma